MRRRPLYSNGDPIIPVHVLTCIIVMKSSIFPLPLPNTVIGILADTLSSEGARPLAGTRLTEKLNMFPQKFPWFPTGLAFMDQMM